MLIKMLRERLVSEDGFRLATFLKDEIYETNQSTAWSLNAAGHAHIVFEHEINGEQIHHWSERRHVGDGKEW